MYLTNKMVSLVLSGGGIKGIAFVGALETAEKMGCRWGNIAGVSAGAVVGSFTGAGYTAQELHTIMEKFDFEKVELSQIHKKIPILMSYMEFKSTSNYRKDNLIEQFFQQQLKLKKFASRDMTGGVTGGSLESEFSGYRGSILKTIITFGKEGCLLDGDYLEEWVYKVLAKKGIKTFGDLKYGIADKVNSNGYKVRMTAVDANRGRVIVLPDDIGFYDIDPDKLEVAKAVRMSTSVPFAFKAVELKKKEGKQTKIYHIVDGGVMDNFPLWLVDSSTYAPGIGFRLDGAAKKKDTPLNSLKGLISEVHDSGIPKNFHSNIHVAQIDTSNVAFLDFNLTGEEKDYLYNEGQRSAVSLFNSLGMRRNGNLSQLIYSIRMMLRRGYFK